MSSMDEKLKACKNCRWFGPIDSYFLTYGMCRKHMKTVHMNFVCDDWEPLWGSGEKEREE
ncbi:hypothetical protein [Thermococcus sp.]|uniref:hypothetical protein n=1 Tax=Thermococcus sp. TaxID=35749 RepID=UPI0025F09ABD|nr:hypothetical protein [Thermococcus sp.]